MNLCSDAAALEWRDCDAAAEEAAMAQTKESYIVTVTYGGHTYIHGKHEDAGAAQKREYSLALRLGKQKQKRRQGGWPKIRTWKLVSETDTFAEYGSAE